MKEFFRKLLVLLGLLAAAPFYITYRTAGFVIGNQNAFPGVSQLMSLFPGLTGQLVRRGFYFMAFKKCDLASTIDFASIFPSTDVVVGRHVYIGARCIIAPCVIEDDVIIGSGVHILSGKDTHHFNSLDKPIREQGGEWKGIRIGRDSWIGNNAIVMADVGAQCVIGAGAVVTKPLADRCVAVGNPARVIHHRV